MSKRWMALLFGATMLVAQSAAAQVKPADGMDMQALRQAVRTDKRALVAATLELTPEEAKKFWPAYDAYQRTLDMVNRERVMALEGVIGKDQPISDLYAKNLANELIAADEIEVKARRTLHSRVMKALPAKKAARYLQLEAKIRATQLYDVAEAIPLVK
jgi:Spy/CpxP family protein refolding chaperone